MAPLCAFMLDLTDLRFAVRLSCFSIICSSFISVPNVQWVLVHSWQAITGSTPVGSSAPKALSCLAAAAVTRRQALSRPRMQRGGQPRREKMHHFAVVVLSLGFVVCLRINLCPPHNRGSAQLPHLDSTLHSSQPLQLPARIRVQKRCSEAEEEVSGHC